MTVAALGDGEGEAGGEVELSGGAEAGDLKGREVEADGQLERAGEAGDDGGDAALAGSAAAEGECDGVGGEADVGESVPPENEKCLKMGDGLVRVRGPRVMTLGGLAAGVITRPAGLPRRRLQGLVLPRIEKPVIWNELGTSWKPAVPIENCTCPVTEMIGDPSWRWRRWPGRR